MKRIGEGIIILGAIVAGAGGVWLRYIAVAPRSLGVGMLLAALGLGIMALGGGVLKLSRSNQSTEKSPSG